MRSILLKVATVIAAGLLSAAPVYAQFGLTVTEEGAKAMESKGLVPPRVAQADIDILAKQPDLQGDWFVTAPVPDNSLAVVFDPFNVYVPYTVAAGLFGPVPGTYMTKIPYNPEWQKKYRKIAADALAGKSRDTYALCTPYGMPRFMGGAAVSFDVLQTPKVISMQNWYDNEQRRIFLDGRPHPTTDPMGGDNPRTRSGHSVGQWDGDTLVVDTVNMVAGVFDDTEAPYSDQIHVMERIRLIDANVMADTLTIEDPIAFTAPWTVTRYFIRRPAAASVHNLADRVCAETIDMSKGYQSLILPQEIEAKHKRKKVSSPTSQSTSAPSASP